MDFEPLLPDSLNSDSPPSSSTHHYRNTNTPSLNLFAPTFTPLDNHHPFTPFLSLIHLPNIKHKTPNSHNSTCSPPRNFNLLDCSHDTSPNNTLKASSVGLEHSTTDVESNDLPSQSNPHSNILPSSILLPSPKETFSTSNIPHHTKCKPSSHKKNLPNLIYKILATEEMMFSVEMETPKLVITHFSARLGIVAATVISYSKPMVLRLQYKIYLDPLTMTQQFISPFPMGFVCQSTS